MAKWCGVNCLSMGCYKNKTQAGPAGGVLLGYLPSMVHTEVAQRGSSRFPHLTADATPAEDHVSVPHLGSAAKPLTKHTFTFLPST